MGARDVTFDEFLAAEFTGLSRYAAVLTGSRQQAHDLLADALIKAQLRWHRIGTMQHPGAYVRRIVTTTFVSEGRRWSARMIRPTRTGEVPDTALPDFSTGLDDRARLSSLLAALPRRQRAAVVLRYYLGYDNAAIATELGITSGAVRTAISRGLAALRIAIAHSVGSESTHELTTYDVSLAPGCGPDRFASEHHSEEES